MVLMQPSLIEALPVHVKVQNLNGRTPHAGLRKPACKYGADKIDSCLLCKLQKEA